MGLQHAIHDVPGDAPDAVDAAGGVQGRRLPLIGSIGGVTRFVSSLVKPRRGGRTSIWRVIALAIIVYVGALNLANFLVVRPVRDKLDGLVAQKGVIEDFIVLRQSGQAVAGVRDGLMRGDERVSVMTEIRDMATEVGLSVVGEPDLLAPRETSKKMTEYPMEITLSGSYHEVGDFLSRLESSPRLLSVQAVDIDARETSPSRAEVRVRVGVLAWEE